LNKGSASLSNTKIAIKGEAQKQAVADAVRTALQTRITTLYQLTQDLKPTLLNPHDFKLGTMDSLIQRMVLPPYFSCQI
ncbi:MAG: hypothetical protein AAF357_04690, partial [Verrucomicrobiota bacterium]